MRFVGLSWKGGKRLVTLREIVLSGDTHRRIFHPWRCLGQSWGERFSLLDNIIL